MYNAITEPTASPMEMLMGLFASRGGKTPDGSDPFSALLGLLPSPVPVNPLIPGNVPTGKTLPGNGAEPPMGKVILSLSPDMMALLGLDPKNLPTQGQVPSPAGSQEPKTQIPAELTTVGDGTNGIISLKILPETQVTRSFQEDLPENLAEGSGDQEIIIPMHLRTVEQVGQKVIATADLLTAAGKETSVRIQWELSGHLNGNQGMVGLSGDKAGSTSESQLNGGPGSLPRLLNNLGATLMVIENIETPPPSTMPALLPGAAAAPKKPMAAKVDGVVARTTVIPSLATMTPLIDGVTTIASVGSPVESTPADKLFDFTGLQAEHERAPGTETADPLQNAAAKAPGVESAVFDTSTGIARTMETRPETPQVRFYDLDSKLDQLKSNPGQKIRIQLAPANLGKMDLTITSHRGMVTVTLTLDSNQAREAVQQSLPSLENRLAASGIRVDNFQVMTAPSPKGTVVAQAHQPFQQDGFAGYRRDGHNQRQEYQPPRHGSFKPSEFTFNAAMVNCLA